MGTFEGSHNLSVEFQSIAIETAGDEFGDGSCIFDNLQHLDQLLVAHETKSSVGQSSRIQKVHEVVGDQIQQSSAFEEDGHLLSFFMVLA